MARKPAVAAEPIYLREPPEMEPALAGAVWRRGHIGEPEIVASLLDLVARRFATMSPAERQMTTIAGPVRTTTLEFRLDTDRWNELKGLDAVLATFLFTGIARESTLTLEELRWQAMRASSEFRPGLDYWKSTVLAEAERRELLGRGGLGRRRLGQAGKEVYPDLRAFKDYLHDFGSLEDDPPAAIALWERYLAWAALFGLANATLEALPMRVPTLAEDPALTVLRDVWRSRAAG